MDLPSAKWSELPWAPESESYLKWAPAKGSTTPEAEAARRRDLREVWRRRPHRRRTQLG